MAKDKKKMKNGADEAAEEIKAEMNEEIKEEAEVENEEIEVSLSPEMKKLAEKCDEIQDKYLRLAAEYDNFRKRSAVEREQTYANAFVHAVSGILPIIDNIERAAQFATDESEMSKGVLMLKKQCLDALEKMGVSAMESDGAEFNPELHNAVMHEEDDSENKNIVSETFQKGYMYGDKVVRHAMVKVLN